MGLYTIVMAILLLACSLVSGGMQWQKMKTEEDKKLGKWLGVAVYGALGVWGLIIFIKGVGV